MQNDIKPMTDVNRLSDILTGDRSKYTPEQVYASMELVLKHQLERFEQDPEMREAILVHVYLQACATSLQFNARLRGIASDITVFVEKTLDIENFPKADRNGFSA